MWENWKFIFSYAFNFNRCSNNAWASILSKMYFHFWSLERIWKRMRPGLLILQTTAKKMRKKNSSILSPTCKPNFVFIWRRNVGQGKSILSAWILELRMKPCWIATQNKMSISKALFWELIIWSDGQLSCQALKMHRRRLSQQFPTPNIMFVFSS